MAGSINVGHPGTGPAPLSRSKRSPDFEKSLAELEKLVEQLEGGHLPLEDALRSFERGVALSRECQAALQAAQARVEILVREGAGHAAEPFDADDDGLPGDAPDTGGSRVGA